MSSDYQQFLSVMGYSGLSGGFLALFLVLAVWDYAWRGVALWKAAKNGSTPWFVCLLVLNTVGILPIIYIFFFDNKKIESVKHLYNLCVF